MNGTVVVVTVAALAAAAVVVVVLKSRQPAVTDGVPAPQAQPSAPVAAGQPAPPAQRAASPDIGKVVQDVAKGIGGAVQTVQAITKGVSDFFSRFRL